ncbi:LOW QUALITY PROTEIN: hypothetical protein PHMEG_0002731 [Phytophthora megakarya]|uniref:ZSWIM1/3 RNaseH-like domain-containing protein n=1 Tax=Phytophthora megakarya TaxID=4795 RepID=A0A225X034_9STRA|nr:LOW QUALITY PROTEIN: hypothetical protein PHMEG_0002731 [Phytophthora megakarya]
MLSKQARTATKIHAHADAIAEVFQQPDEEDELQSHGDSDDKDYEEGQDSVGFSETASVDADSEGKQNSHRKSNPKLKVTKGSSLVEMTAVSTMRVGASVHGGFLEGFPLFCESWDKFHDAFHKFEESIYQHFSCLHPSLLEANRLSELKKNVKAEETDEKGIDARDVHCFLNRGVITAGPTIVRMLCRTNRKVVLKGNILQYDLKARVNVRVKLRPSGEGYHLVVNASGAPDHALTECRVGHDRILTFGSYQQHTLSRKGKRTTLRDIHNTIQESKQKFCGGSVDAERALAVLHEFIEATPGNTAEFIVDSENNIVRVVTFQSARQKRLFTAFPEVVLVDATHDTNVNGYKLFRFAVHDVFGLGQYVQHALVHTEEKANLALAVSVFKRNHPG